MKVIIVSPHPDDETLGAGGTILRLINEGNDVVWINMTCMDGNSQFSDEIVCKRKEQLEKIEKIYGFSKVYYLDLPTTKLEKLDSSEAIEQIASIFQIEKPQLLILPDYNDAHSDHKKTFDWCYACSKSFRFPYVKQIMTMEILSETNFGRPENTFVPNTYVDITQFMDKKMQALKIYDTELGEPPFPRSIESVIALATLRGTEAGTRYAEAFRTIKTII